MDVEERLSLIRGMAEEIVTEEELRGLLELKRNPVAYDGFEPSGLANIAFGILRPINLQALLSAGVRFKLLLADWYAWINNKFGGDLEKIRQAGEYFIDVWRAAGVDLNKVEVLWTSDIVRNEEYWKKVILIAKHTTLSRTMRSVSIMGRKMGELKETAQLFYPMMQAADIFWLDVDICQLGLDQRRANILARDVAGKLGWKKPVVVSHHMLMGLEGVKQPEGYDTNPKYDIQISSKMSKSKPSSGIFVHDSAEEIAAKVRAAYCPAKVVQNNPVLEYAKFIVFRKFRTLKIERPEKYGGPIELASYKELERLFADGTIHPLDLKNAVALKIDELVSGIREHFQKDDRARELYNNLVSGQSVTR